MRTDAELLEFALVCEKIEKQGGDVLGYIEQEYPSYTPRATWYRLQKTWLNRTAAQLTEGKPKEKGVKYMGKMMDLAKGCIEAFGRGESVYDFLASQGSKNPSAYWYQIKATVKLKDPDLYEQLSVIRTDNRKNAQEPKTVTFGGKEYEKMEGPSPTCCQPAPPSGVTVPDELPEEPEPLMIAALLSSVDPAYKYELIKMQTRSDIHMALCWRDKICNQEHSLIFTPADWKKLSKEILTAIEQFGI